MYKNLNCLLALIFILIITLSFHYSNNNGYFVDGSSNVYEENTYDSYLDEYGNLERPDIMIEIKAADFTDSDENVSVLIDFEGDQGESIITSEEGFVEWRIDVEKEGLYNIEIEYYPIIGRNSSIERKLIINGKSPYEGAEHLNFTRVWKDAGPIRLDNRDNELRPRQIEEPMWLSTFFSDYMGYLNEPYLFRFHEGSNIIRLESVREPMVIKSLVLKQAPTPLSYNEIFKEYTNSGYKKTTDQYIKVQGEHAVYKSDPTLYPIFDRSSPATQPYHKSKIRLNTIGGYRWDQPEQWITWNIPIDEPGLYQVAIKYKQNFSRGSFSNRKLLINDEVPFEEVKNIQFSYDSKWNMKVLGEEEPYMFYFDKGIHELKLENTLGELADILRVAENSVFELNKSYRRVLMITGQTPDEFRDYQIEKNLPDVIEILERQSEILEDLSAQMRAFTNQRGSHAAILDTLSRQLGDFVKSPHTIPSRLNAFRGNIGALSTWILITRQQPLEIDYIIVASSERKLPKADVGFFGRLIHELRALIASYTEDYNSVGDVYDEQLTSPITVWIGTGRDQAQILKDMIDDSFTPRREIPVNLKLVQPGVLLPATVAGIGPDVALQVGHPEPVNYAIRNAIVDLSGFDDFNSIIQQFHESAVIPYRFEGGVYALPEQQVFSMLFYRRDILEELGLKIPNTWDDIFEILPEIQKRNMDIALPVSMVQPGGGIVSYGGMTTYNILLHQMGGQMYKEGGVATDIDSELGIEAFRIWTSLYSNYKLPLQFDMLNRFRTGEIPIGIADYNLYNTLTVFAPELRGRWEFAPVPGFEQSDGTIRRDVPSYGTNCIMLDSARDKDDAWEFMKWWVSSDTQVRFGREMESLMGPAARYPTANIEALGQLPWPIKDYKNLMDQWEWVRGIPEVPGGYFLPRHLDNAFRSVVLHGDDPRETLLDYVRIMNEEIDIKRIEFGLESGN